MKPEQCSVDGKKTMIKAHEELLNCVLDCANRVAGTSLGMPQDGDIAMEAFGFDSLSLFAFIIELEGTCGIEFEDALLDQEYLRSIRSVAALIASLGDAHPSSAIQIGVPEGTQHRLSGEEEGRQARQTTQDKGSLKYE